MSKAKNDTIHCSFCGKEKKDVNVLIAGITGHICDSCISQAYTIIKEDVSLKTNKEIASDLKLLKPQLELMMKTL